MVMRGSSAAGGGAGKRGDRYEERWTIWKGVVPVLTGAADALMVEPPGLAGEGIEFRVECGSVAEVHQAKRTRVGGSWTVHALIQDGVLGPLGDQLNRDGT